MFLKFKLLATKLFNIKKGPVKKCLKYAYISFSIVYCVTEYVADIKICSGPSMEPTLFTNDAVITEYISTRNLRFNYGDIVVSKSPVNPKEYVCKRITGLPGDRITVSRTKTEFVPRGHVWLEGDNRDNSLDSRTYGPVPQGLIAGRVICKIWPLTDITKLTVESEGEE